MVNEDFQSEATGTRKKGLREETLEIELYIYIYIYIYIYMYVYLIRFVGV